MEGINLDRSGRISPRSLLGEERTYLQSTRDVIQKAWDAEIKCYEMGLKQDVTHPSQLQHLNHRIFPYHKSCYLLLDMYLCVEGEFLYNVPFCISEYARRDDNIILEECYLPNSAYAIWSSLVPAYRARATSNELSDAEQTLRRGYEDKTRKPSDTIWVSSHRDPVGSDFSFLTKWTKELERENQGWYSCHDLDGNGVVAASPVGSLGDGDHSNEHYVKKTYYAIPLLETLPKGQRTKVLLKLLKHATSELQRDHRLARAILLTMIEYKCLDGEEGVEAFRYFLCTIQSEFIYDCDEACHDREEDLDDESHIGVNHVCTDWQKFTHAVSRVLQWGIRQFTEKHAIVLSAFLKDVLTSKHWEEAEDLHDIVGWNDDDFTMAKDTPLDLVNTILEGLSRLCYQFRCRIWELLKLKYSSSSTHVAETNDRVHEELYATVRSHLNCRDVLVSMAESVLKTCPATPVTETMGSLLVTGLALSSIDPLVDHAWYLNGGVEGRYIGSKAHVHIRSLLDATRYADKISYASVASEKRLHQFRDHLGPIHSSHKIENDEIISNLFLLPPPMSIQAVVRGLFLRQLVETNEAGCGYGDFMLWTGNAISPLDPMLYEHNMNFPNNTSYDEERLQDEHGHILTTDQIKARYDLSILMLRQAWSLPWTPSSHDSFQTLFRKAIRTIALVANRHHFPLDLCLLINSFLSRDWWPDDRARCWRYDCDIDVLQGHLALDEDVEGDNDAVNDVTMSSNTASTGGEEEVCPKLVQCKGCRVAHACSKKHMKDIFHEGHLRECRCPPMRVPTSEDIDFCNFYLGGGSVPVASYDISIDKGHADEAMDEGGGSNEDGDDADDDWESIGSHEDGIVTNEESKNASVLKYFESKAYKVQKREEHAFANHYAYAE